MLPAFAAEPVSAPTAAERVVPVVDFEPTIARDGRLAFISNRNGTFELYTADADGKQLKQLTASGGGKDTPAWSPDGSQIAYVVETDGKADIHLIGADGRHARRLTTGPDNELHPFWAPGGKRLVFTRYVDVPAGAGRLSVHAMDVDGRNEMAITRGGSASYASFSPDGTHLSYWRMFGDNADIVVAAADGSDERRLTHDPAFDGWPSWAPDGKAIAFARERAQEKEADIYLLDPSTGAERLLVGGAGRKTAPKWNADGTAVLFDWTRDGATGIWRVPVASDR